VATAATAEAVVVSMVVGSTGEASAVVVSVGDVSAVVVSTAVAFVGDVSAVVVSTAVAFVGDVSAVVVSTTVAFVGDVLMGATSAITDSLMMCSSAASDFRGGGAGTILTDITPTVTIDTVGTRTAMDTAVTVTKVAPVMDIAMEPERVMDTAMAVEPVTGTAMVADQAISGVRGVGDKPGYGSLKFRRPVGVWRSNCK
jgi:hypothetical protein